MAAFQYTNFGESALASGITAAATTCTVTATEGAKFPSSGDFQIVFVRNSDGAREIAKCTSRATDVLTIVRAQETTTGLVLVTSDKVELRVTAEILNSYISTSTNNTYTGTNTFNAAVTITSGTAIGLTNLVTTGGALTGITNLVATGGTITGITDITVADGGTGASTHTTNNVLIGAGTSAITSIAPGTDGQVLTSTGTVWQSEAAAGGGVPAGTEMLFFQASAPTGWTQTTAQNDKALRVVSGTGGGSGGTVAFETAFASQAVAGTNTGTAISIAQMPAHTHTVTASDVGNMRGNLGQIGSGAFTTGSTGSGSTHTHTFSGTAIDLDVNFINVITATKD